MKNEIKSDKKIDISLCLLIRTFDRYSMTNQIYKIAIICQFVIDLNEDS